DGTTPTVKASSITSPAHGTAVLITTGPDTGKILYTPAANYNGPDSFTYKATDGGLDSNVAAVSITITPVNDAPVCANVSITTDEDTAGAVDLSGTDVESCGLIYTVGGATNRSWSVSRRKLRYSPNANFNGSDSFSYTADDGHGGTSTATVNVTITPVNDKPTADAKTVNADEDTSKAITLSGTDVESCGLSFSIVSGPSHG